jgi:hypothetical protein
MPKRFWIEKHILRVAVGATGLVEFSFKHIQNSELLPVRI